MNRGCVCLCFCSLAGTVYAASHVPGEVLASIQSDYLVPPSGKTAFSPDSEYTDSALMAILLKYQVSEISKVFPTFGPAEGHLPNS